MMQTTVAARYAEALFAIAQEKSSFDQLETELKLVEQVIEQNQQLKKLLNHPHVDKKVKKEILSNILKGQISEVTENFLYLLIDKKRQNVFVNVVSHFTLLANEARGLADATVIAAKELTTAQLEQIANTFKNMIGKNLRIATEIDKDVIGGFIVRIGDRVYDSSLQTQLKRMQATLR